MGRVDMRIRPLGKSLQWQLEKHAAIVSTLQARHDAKYADRHGDSPIQLLNRRFYEMGPDYLPEAPRRYPTSNVVAFRPRLLGDGMHPEAHQYFEADELLEVVEEAAETQVVSRESFRHVDYIENSQYDGMLAYQTESQEKGQLAYENKLRKRNEKMKRRAQRGYKVAEDLADSVDPSERERARKEAEKWADRRASLAEAIRDRLENGFYSPGGLIAGDHYDAFHEFFGAGVLRSRLASPSLARFPQIVPKADRIRCGYDKNALFESATKLFALDCPYVELDRKRACCIVVEMDTVWKSPAALRKVLLQILPPHMMPNLMVGRTTRDGQFARPHLIWFLNPKWIDPDGVERDATVWYEPYSEWVDQDGVTHCAGDKRCRKGPINMYHRIQRGLVSLLLPLGADPACWNLWKPKNPLSPFWTTVVLNDDYWPILESFENIKDFPKWVDEAALHEQATKARASAAGLNVKNSNLTWATVGNVIEPLVRLQLRVREGDFVAAGQKGPQALAAWFEKKVRPEVEKELGPSAGLDRVLERRCEFAANYCLRQKRKTEAKHRGRDRHLVFQISDAEERKRETGRRSAAQQRGLSMWEIKKAIWCQIKATGEVRKTEFIKEARIDTGLAQSTLYRWFDAAVAELGLEFRDGVTKIKSLSYPGGQVKPSLPVQALPSSELPPSAQDSPGSNVDADRPPWVDRGNWLGSSGPPGSEVMINGRSAADVRPDASGLVPEAA